MSNEAGNQLPILSGPDVLSLIRLNPKVIITNRQIVLDSPLVLEATSFVYMTMCYIHPSNTYDVSNTGPLVTLNCPLTHSDTDTQEPIAPDEYPFQLVRNYINNPHGLAINDDVSLNAASSNLFEAGVGLPDEKRGWYGTNIMQSTANMMSQDELDAAMPKELKPCETTVEVS